MGFCPLSGPAEFVKRRKQHGYVAAASFVIVYLGIGQNEQAFTWPEEAYKEGSNILQFAKVHPLFCVVTRVL